MGTSTVYRCRTVKQPPLILVIDDEFDQVRLISSFLKECGYPVLTGMDGSQAVQLALKHKPDLLIMDVNMPLTNGVNALNFLRENQQTAIIPIILLTGQNSAVMVPIIERYPRTAYLKKPVDLDSLGQKVAEMLHRYGASSEKE